MTTFKEYLIEKEDIKKLFKNNPRVERQWEKRTKEAKNQSRPSSGITSQVNWGGFRKSISYTEVKYTNELIQKLVGEDMVNLKYKGENYYMTLKDYKKIEPKLTPHIKKWEG